MHSHSTAKTQSRSGGGDGSQDPHPSRWRRNLAFAVFGTAAAYFLLTEHYAHTVQALPYLLVLACPLSHVFLHGSHSKHQGDDR